MQLVLGPPYPHHPCPGHRGNGSWLPAPREGQPGEGQRLTPHAPDNGGRPSPPGTASDQLGGMQPLAGHASQRDSAGPPRPQARAYSTRVAHPDSLPGGRAAKGKDVHLTSEAPNNGARHPPSWTPSRQPHSAPRRLARARAVGPVLGPPYAHHLCLGHTGNGSWPPAPRDGLPGEGQRLTTDVPQKDGKPPPPGRPLTTPSGHAGHRDSAGPPRLHARAHSKPVADRNSPPQGWAGGGSDAPHNAVLPPPQRATPARKSARCAA